ncbi:Abi family protein [Paenarthrobacter sp. AMU7]|uniref:Abi family protein n=1 Tax=Paenarthrobacter sp. AMU7 TaxID=3162492 RepID=A0AB39YTT0_9MICC
MYTKFDAWTTTWKAAIKSGAEDEDFIKHHLLKYPNQEVRIWAVTEVLSFGNLRYLFELMQTPDARDVARMFGFAHPSRFGAMLRMMVDFRNACAHGSRLFNRAFKRQIALGKHDTNGDLLTHVVDTRFHEHAQTTSTALHLRRHPGIHAQVTQQRLQLASDV